MNSREIRSSFLEFFKSKEHTIVPSASLIPAKDPTLLFTNAGMNQFKDIFLGAGTRSYTRAADSQKCIRVSGKHNDLEEVGHDTSHHTFFEMLGNWSFGDYYKREAISFAYELLTEIWNLPKDKLWATVYLDDDEAAELWLQVTDIPADRVLRFGKDNFWEMGDTGPCGPCSEIHIDLGPEHCIAPDDPDHECGVNSGCPRYLELWNLVFIQYDRDEKGELHPLPKKHVDTGLGFERITAILQGKSSDYDTGLFIPIISQVEDLSGVKYHAQDGISHRVISDHIRCLTFAISDGVMPSNEGRGYVIRRILRRAVLYGKKIGLDEPFLHKLVNSVIDIMGDAYPEINQRQEFVKKIIRGEEERFLQTLDRGLEILDSNLSKLKSEGRATLSGKKAFELSDTYGFPLDLTRIVANEEGCSVDEDGFRKALQEQRERSRKAYEEETGMVQKEAYTDVYQEYGATEFLGYEKTRSESKIVALISGDELVSTADEGKMIEIVLDKTPFYGEAGGQIGDTGEIFSDACKIEVVDTIKPIPDLTVHKCKIIEGNVEPGQQVIANVDTERRKAIAISHTATHILHDVLREVLGDHVRQSGSFVEPGRLRFDFTHFEAVSPDELREIEKRINRKVRDNSSLSTGEMGLQEAKDEGALAFFGEKYGDEVRVVQIGDYSMELCGGTHLNSTGEIGLVKIISESSIAAGVRRIEAFTGEAAYLRQSEDAALIAEISAMLKAKRTEIPEQIKKLLDEQREMERENKRLQDKLALTKIDELIENAQTVDGVNLVTSVLGNIGRDGLRTIVDDLKNRLDSGVIVLASKTEKDVAFVTGVTRDLVENKGLKAGDIVREVAIAGGGQGGGRPEFAQGGSRDASRINEAIEAVPDILKSKASSLAR